MVKERGDWCISRQRTWGVPIPVFYNRTNGEVLLNADTLAHIQSLIAAHGADVWWEKDESELLPAAYASEASDWRKGTDTMDVWFDSGSSWAAVASQRDNLSYPADLYLEGPTSTVAGSRALCSPLWLSMAMPPINAFSPMASPWTRKVEK
jgi:isoleucyl-tRNA synthetase